jgi:hypothetical protein
MLLWLSLLAAVEAAPQARNEAAMEVPPARPGDVAIMEELQAARASRRVADYELFIARHPSHPLARVARAELEALRGRKR